MLELLVDCPGCRRWHDEPASANVGVRVLCLDCELDARMHDAFVAEVSFRTTSRAA